MFFQVDLDDGYIGWCYSAYSLCLGECVGLEGGEFFAGFEAEVADGFVIEVGGEFYVFEFAEGGDLLLLPGEVSFVFCVGECSLHDVGGEVHCLDGWVGGDAFGREIGLFEALPEGFSVAAGIVEESAELVDQGGFAEEGLPSAVVDESDGSADLGQSSVGVIGPEAESVFGP